MVFNSTQYQKERYELFISLAIKRLGSACVTCGDSKDLEFDHIDPKTKYKNVTQMTGFSFNKFLEEVDKCQLLCNDCHNKKSSDEKRTGATHGKYYAAIKLNCGCLDCRSYKVYYLEQRRIQRTGSPGQARKPRIHGTYAMYKAGCREDCCRAANTEYNKNLRQRTIV